MNYEAKIKFALFEAGEQTIKELYGKIDYINLSKPGEEVTADEVIAENKLT